MLDIKRINFHEFLKDELGEDKYNSIVDKYQEQLLNVNFDVFLKHYEKEQILTGKNTKYIVILSNRRKDPLDVPESNPLLNIKTLRDFKISIEKNDLGPDEKSKIKKSLLNHSNESDLYFKRFCIDESYSYDHRRYLYRAYLGLVCYFHNIYSRFEWHI